MAYEFDEDDMLLQPAKTFFCQTRNCEPLGDELVDGFVPDAGPGELLQRNPPAECSFVVIGSSQGPASA
jgi:hypothetical protein